MKHVFRSLVLFVCLAICGRAVAASVTLSWTASTSDTVAGYNVYFGTSSGNYTNKLNAGNSTTFTVPDLTPGVTYYLAATAYDSNGNESGFTGEVTYIVPGILTMTPAATPGGAPLIKFPVAPGSWYEVQATTDLQNWTTVAQTAVMTDNMWMQYTDADAVHFASRFYRLVQH